MRFGCLLVLGGCGRIGFASLGSAGDGGGDASPSLCGSANVLVCDGFEAGLNSRWTADTFGGVFAIDSSRAYRGASSMHFHTDAIASSTMDPRATILTSQGLPIVGIVYARAWAYFASPNPTTYFDQILNFADTAGTGISFGAQNGFVVDNDYTSPQYLQSATVHLPLDRWTCLELAIPSGKIGTARLYVDGTEVTDVAIARSSVQPAPDHIYIGLEWVTTITSQSAVDAWLDEVIVDDKPTVCAE